MKPKGYQLLSFIFLIVFQPGFANAQERAAESKSININNQGLFQIDFTSPINNQSFLSPADANEYYVLKPLKDNKSITLQTDRTALPPTVLKIEETNGKIWNIHIVYKEDIDLENESVFDFADNSIERSKNNIVLNPTEVKNLEAKQTEAIPYSSDELGLLKKTYPGIDFTTPPPAQTFNLVEIGKTNVALIDDFYNRAPGLKLAFKNEMTTIEIICQDLDFDGNNAYLKLLIQNNGSEDFLTGSMLLTLVRQNAPPLSLHPIYIHPRKFPILKPQFQIPIIYAFKAFDVTPDDNLKFEISDRQQKINLEFTIPGPEYNQARKD